MTKQRTKQLGIGLLELMLSLAIISVLLVMATKYYQQARTSQRVNEAISLTEVLIAAGANWEIGKPDFADITIGALVTQGLVPTYSKKDPWYGDVAVSPEDSNKHMGITLKGIPNGVCEGMKSKFASYVVSAECTADAGIKITV